MCSNLCVLIGGVETGKTTKAASKCDRSKRPFPLLSLLLCQAWAPAGLESEYGWMGQTGCVHKELNNTDIK